MMMVVGISEAANTLGSQNSGLLQDHVGHVKEMLNVDEATLMAMAAGIRGLWRPDPALVRDAQLAIARIEADLSLHLTCLPAVISTNYSPTTTHSSSPAQHQENIAVREAALRQQAEEAKRSYQTIIALHELHQISEKLMVNQENVQTMPVLQKSSTTGIHPITMTVPIPVQANDTAKVDLGSNDGNSNTLQDSVVASVLKVAWQQNRTDLDLSGLHLQHLSELSSFNGHFSHFSSLVCLDLSKNQLKELPESITHLRNLENLDLQSNQLSKLPLTIGSLSRLRTLNLSGNMLTSLPDSIGKCRSLQELNIAFNQLENLPLTMGYGLTSLRVLSLHSNKLAFITPSICHLMQLKVLDLHFNKLQNLPSNIGNLKKLERLYLNNNFSDFGGALPHSIGKLVCLVELDLSSNQIKILPNCIGALSKLKVLKVDNNPLMIPPVKVVEHSMEAMLEYLKERWISSQQEVTHTSIKQLQRSKTSSVHTTTTWLTSFIGNNSCKNVKYATPISSIKRVVDRPHRSFRISHEI